jgi:hypothetical protein
MAVTKADLDRVFALEASVPDDSSLSCFRSTAEVLAFSIAQARAEPDSGDECDVVELIVRSAGLPPTEMRELERELRPLGYDRVCDRLRSVAGKRKHGLKPLR